MNEKAIRVAYELFVADGYTKSIDEFKNLMRDNPKGREVAYNLFVNDGYNKSINDFAILMGATESLGTTPGAESTVKKKDEGMALPSEDGSLDSSETDVISKEDLLQQTVTPSDRMQPKPTQTQVDYELGFNVAPDERIFEEQTVSEAPTQRDEFAGTIISQQPPKAFSEPVVQDGVSVSEQVKYDPFIESVNKVVNKELVSTPFFNKLPLVSMFTRPAATEENVIPQMQYYFGEYGFEFETADWFGDGMIVKAKNKKQTYVNLDQAFGGEKTAEDLKKFLIENREVKEYAASDRKIYDEQQIKDAVGVLNEQAKEWNNATVELGKIKALNEKMSQELIGISQYDIDTNPEIKQKVDMYNQNIAAEKELLDVVMKKGEEFEGKGILLDRLAGEYYAMKGEQGGMIKGITAGILGRGPANMASGGVDYGVDIYTYLSKNASLTEDKYKEELIRIAKEDGYLPEDEDFSGLSKQQLIERLGGDTNDATSFLKSLALAGKQMLGFDPIGREKEEEALGVPTNFDKVNAKVLDYARKGIKYYNDYGVEGLDYDKAVEGRTVNPFSEIAAKVDTEMGLIDASRQSGEILSENLGATKEWSDLTKEGFWGGALLGFAESIPAMVGGMDKVGSAQRIAQMFLLTSSYVEDEMSKNPEFDNISESEKLPIKIAIGTVGAVLENYGVRNIISKNSFVANLALRALKKVPKGSSVKTLSDVISQDIESSVARFGLAWIGAGASEFETGAAQELSSIIIKDIYNETKDKEMFQTPESLRELAGQVLYAGAQEAVGGKIMGAPGAIISAVGGKSVQSLSDMDWRNFEMINEDPTMKEIYVSKLKAEIANPKSDKTLAEAKAELESVNRIQGILNSNKQYIGNLSPEQKKRAVQLLLQKQELENKLKNADSQLSSSDRNLLKRVNDELGDLSKASTRIEESMEAEGKTIQEYKGNLMDWIKSIGKSKDIGDVMEGGVEIDMDGTKVIMTESDGGVVLESIETQKGKKGKGKAEAAIKQITEKADNDGVNITLKVVPKDSTVDAKRLQSLYERNGFEMQEDGVTMVRTPKVQELTQEQRDIESFFAEDTDEDIERASDNLSINRTNQEQGSKSPNRANAISAAKFAAKAISKVAPKVRIVLHEAQSEYSKYVKGEGSSSGEYNPVTNVIHINLSNVRRSTVAHEVFHAILVEKVKGDDALAKKISDDMVRVVQRRLPKNHKLRVAVEAHAAKYQGDQANLQTEEQIAELIGLLSSVEGGYTQLDSDMKSVIKKFFLNLAKKLNIPLPKNWGSDQDVVDLINTLARKTRTGEEITEADVKLLDVKEDTEGGEQQGTEGGEFLENPANSLRQQKVGDFEVTYTEDDKIAQYVKDGRITEPKDILDIFKDLNISNVEVLVHSPDDMLAGEIKYKGETIFEGSGGVFFVTKFGEVWASTEDAANQIVKGLNKQVEEQGKGFMLLTKGTDQKLMSSPTGVDGAMKVIGKMLEAKIFSPSEFRTAVSKAVSKEQNRLTIKAKKDGEKAPKFKPFSLRKSADDIMADITTLFSDENSGTFETRGNIVKGIGNALASAKLTSEQESKAAKFLGGDTARRVGVASTVQKGTGNPLSQGLSDLIALTLAEKLTKGLKTGDVYAVIEVNQKVKPKKSTHPSYDTSIVTLDGKPPTLHLLKNRQPGKEVLTPIFGKNKNKPYSVGQVPTMTGQINLEKKVEPKATDKTPATRQQRTMQQVAREFNMSESGFFPKNVDPYFLKKAVSKAQGDYGIKKARTGNFFLVDGRGRIVKDLFRRPTTRQQRTTRLAPNGKRSNLTDVQYDLVRTPAFKNWFGDWENDPKNASKVVDENGEPMVMYHGTSDNFDEFLYGDKLSEEYEKLGYYTGYNNQFGTHFGDIETAEVFSKKYDGMIMPVFLNIKNPLETPDLGSWESTKILRHLRDKNKWDVDYKAVREDKKSGGQVLNEELSKKGVDGFVYKNYIEGGGVNSYIIIESKQAKLADGSNKTFDPSKPSIRQSKSTQEYISEARQENFKDSVIRDFLVRVKGKSAKEVDELMSLSVSLLDKMPKSFGNVKGGAKVGLKLYDKVERFRIQEQKRNNKRKNKLTEQEIIDKTIEFLEKQPEYINEGDTYTVGSEKKGTQKTLFRAGISSQQAKMLSDIQKSIGIRPTQNMGVKIAKARLALRQRRKGAIDLQKVKTEVRNFIRKTLPSELYEKKEVLDLINKINEANEGNIENIISEIEAFVIETNNKSLEKEIKKILDDKYQAVKSDISIPKKIADEVRKRIDFINKNLVSPKATPEDIGEANTKLLERFNEIQEQNFITPEQIEEQADIQVAMQYNNAMLMENSNANKVTELDGIYSTLKDLINHGRSLLQEELRKSHEAYNKTFELGYEAITGEKVDMNDPDSKRQLNNQKKKRFSDEKRKKNTQNVIRRFVSNIGTILKAPFGSAEALNGLMSRLDKLPGEMFGGRLNEMFTERVDESSRRFKMRMMQVESVIANYLAETYGKKWKQISRQNRMQVDHNIELHDGIMLQPLSQDDIGYLYNMYKDPANRASFANPDMWGSEVIEKDDSNDLRKKAKELRKQGKIKEAKELVEKAKAEKERKQKINEANAARVMKELEAKLDPKVKEFADWQVDVLYPALYEEYNKTYKKLYRTDLPWNKFYAGTIYRDGFSEADTEVMNLLGRGNTYKTAVGANATKVRQGSNLPIKPMNMTDVLNTYINDMEYFAAYGETIRDMDKFFSNKYVKSAIIDIHGQEVYTFVDDMIKKIASRGMQNSGFKAKTINALNDVFILSRLALSPVIAIKQLTSTFTYANDIGYANWIKYAAINKTQQLKVWKEISENSVYIQDRYKNSITKAIETYSDTKMKAFLPEKSYQQGWNWFVDFAMYTTKLGDKGAIYLGGSPNYSYYKDQALKQGKTEKEAIDIAIRKFERDTKRTQQSSDIQDKDYLQTGDPITKALNMFLTTPKQYLRNEIIAVRNLYRAISGKAYKGTVGQNVRTFATYHFFMPLLFQYVSMGLPGILRGFRDDDDEDLLRAAIIGNLNGLFILGEVVNTIGDLFTGKPWVGTQTKSLGILQIANSIGRKLNKASNYTDKNKRDKAFLDAYLEIATLTGMPAPTIKKFFDNYSKLNTTDDPGEIILRLLNYSEYQISGAPTNKSKVKSVSEMNEEYQKEKEKKEKDDQKDRIGFYD